MRRAAAVAAIGLVVCAATLRGQQPASGPGDAERRNERYRIGTMERVLENAVEHGATVTRDRLRAVIPANVLLSEEARARGFRLEGYGVFFDVLVPNLEGTLPWIYRTLDQTDLGLASALNTLRARVSAQGSDQELEQALKRIELQMSPYAMATTGTAGSGQSSTQGSAEGPSAGSTGGQAPAAPADPILNNPEDAYRAEVTEALMDAMLTHSQGLGLGSGEWLTVGARRDESPRLSVGDAPPRTIQISVRADDVRAYLAGQMTREQARARMTVRVF